MADVDTKQEKTTNESAGGGSGGSAIRPSFSFVMTPPGILLCINLALLFLSWCIMAAWKNDITDKYSLPSSWNSKTGFFLFATVFPWLLFIVFFVLMLFQLNKQLTMINWPLTMAINCITWAVILLIASALAADLNCNYSGLNCDTLKAAAAFGFLSMIGLVVQGVLHFMEFRSG